MEVPSLIKVPREMVEKAIDLKGGVYQGAVFPYRVWLLEGELVRVPAKPFLDENDMRILQAKLAAIEISVKKVEK